MKEFWNPQNLFKIYCILFSSKFWKESVTGHKLFQERKHISSMVSSLLVLRTISRFWKMAQICVLVLVLLSSKLLHEMMMEGGGFYSYLIFVTVATDMSV